MTREEIEALDGEALAAAVAERVMGWTRHCGYWHRGPGRDSLYSFSWLPDRDISQAFEVMRARPEWQQWSVRDREETVLVRLKIVGFVEAEVRVVDGDRTRALCEAICRCALMAVQE